MDTQGVLQRTERVFRQVFSDDSLHIGERTTASDVKGWDSFSNIILVLAIEKEFGLHLNAAEVGKLDNVGDLLKVILRRATR